MGCRCGDIRRYEKDISWITKAEGHASDLAGHASEVRTSLDTLKSQYSETVNAQDDFLTEFGKLDEDVQPNVGIIMTQLSGAKRTLEEWLRAARAEDEAHHAAEARRCLQ